MERLEPDFSHSMKEKSGFLIERNLKLIVKPFFSGGEQKTNKSKNAVL